MSPDEESQKSKQQRRLDDRNQAAGLADFEDAAGGSVVDPIIGRLFWVRKPSPAAWGLEAERMPDESGGGCPRRDHFFQRWFARPEFHCRAFSPAYATGATCGRPSDVACPGGA